MTRGRKLLCSLIRICITLNWIVAIFFAFHFAITGRMYMSSSPVSSMFVIFTCILVAVLILPQFLKDIENGVNNPEDSK
ncbi:putative membrane protein [Brevibacillus fulvus]|uniref:Membrane protein n=1 Tax=Brevibacillus fulvus TaxID=1125967 RepID=A0A938Y0K9_9BACL|nr:putative membrane protein [Brevibacillus fulvus]